MGRELIILGYDLDNDAIKESTVYTDYEDGYLIEYYDKYDNLYYIYQLINDNEVKYYLLDSDDVDECIEKVRRAGFKVTVEPMDIEFPPKDRPLKARVAFCEGPAGESVEFFKEI